MLGTVFSGVAHESHMRVRHKQLTLCYSMTSELTLEAVKFSGEGFPQTPPKSFCTSHGSSYKRSVPMLCPSIGNVLATPLQLFCLHSTLVWLFSAVPIIGLGGGGGGDHPPRELELIILHVYGRF